MTISNFPMRRRHVLLTAVMALAAAGVQAQSYPNKPIRLLVGYSAGGGVDTMARVLAPRLANLLGQQVVVENRAGASGLIAGEAVAKAAPDGYTLLLGESGLLIAQHMQARMSFDPIKSFTPVAGLFTTPLMIVASNSFPAKTPKELVAALKANPAKYSYATPGVGTVQHLGFEMLKGRIDAFVVHIPYRGAAQIVPDVIGGQVPLGVVSATAALAQSRAGKLRAIATLSPVRLPGAEDVQPISDALPGFNVAPRLYLTAPAGTPTPVIERLGEAVRAVLSTPELAQAVSAQGAVPAYLAADQLAVDLVRESAGWGQFIKTKNITD